MKQTYLVVINTLRHAMIISADSNEELFDAIDEFVSPYSCLIMEEDDLSVCFETDVVLDAKDGEVDMGDLILSNHDGIFETGDYCGLALMNCGEEIRNIRNGNPNYDTEWMTFNNNHTDLIPFTQHKGFMSELMKNIDDLPLVDTGIERTTETIVDGNPDETPSILEKAMQLLLEKPEGITHYDVGCHADDLGAITFAIQHGYIEQMMAETKEETTH